MKLLLLVGVALVPALGALAYALLAHRQLLVSHARAEAGELAHLVAELHQRPVDGAHGLLLALTRLPAMVGRDPACSAQLAPLLGMAPAYLNVGAVDPDGKVFCSAAPARGAIDLSDRRYFRHAIETGGFGVGEFVVSRIRGKGGLGFGQVVRSPDGSVAAVAFASLDVGHLQRSLDAANLVDSAEVQVLDRGGIIIASRGHPETVGTVYDPTRLGALRTASEPLDLPSADGTQRVHALHVVSDRLGEPVLQVVASLPTVSTLSQVNRITGLALAGFGLAAVLALGVTALAGELLLVRKVRALAVTARRISSGDVTARTGLQPGGDEVGDLVHSVDEMAGSLERQAGERRHLEDQLRQSQKLEAVGQLAGGVAHDFNNLLTAIIGSASMIEAELPESHPSHLDAREIARSGERAANLTRQLLAFSRRQRLEPRPFELAAAVKGLEGMLRRLLGEHVELVVDASVPGPILADAGQIEQVIVNLAVNARDAMPAGGRLTIAVGELALREGAMTPGATVPRPPPSTGPHVSLTVSDTGIGMAPETIARIFEPFFTTKGPSKGTGLGLSTVYGIVVQSGGAIQVDSAPGAGAKFTVLLPRFGGPIAPVQPSKALGPAGGSETVLVVEDDAAVRSVTCRVLRAGGYAVIEAEDAHDAWFRSARAKARVALLLTDVRMPGEDGLSLARRLLEARPGLRVVYMSGYTGDVDVTDLPPDARLLAKPFTPGALLEMVRRTLDG